ncbi:RNA polymerase sigma factor SigB [Sporolactobacillus spathodeae]|uniref:RNA polymerase sigma-B factor n=1 Tax=Sporolactobacillus spathodeae TaxID=1465502 RepID=A0ABS2QBD2_9BACL|nr:RNA polymerase sigma factor SigB [Sporolactobacillus spathodeae]MBM7658936.1 RNA polymerase sigma-B factor [Sporolactobacillus spathodeae]
MQTRSQLTQSEVRRLILAYQKEPGNDQIQHAIIANYENLIAAYARKFSRGNDTWEDLFQVGMIGLIAAIQRFDSSFEQSFESFAIPTIIGEIKRYIRDKTWSVHVPRRVKELGPRIHKAVEELTRSQQRSPTIKEIAAFINEDVEKILESLEMLRSYYALSVDSKIDADHEGHSVTLLDLIGMPDHAYERVHEKIVLEKAFEVLSEREKQIILCTFFDNLSQKETGKMLGISQMHVSRLLRRALHKLRETLPHDGKGEIVMINKEAQQFSE